ncbi:MAG: hypothetical protein J0G94_15365 [Sphingomonadales bacterium]|nr:hypothetical protein [Sphingomonadales bacterium]
MRELALVILIGILLFNPPVLVGWLKNSQLEKVGVFGISFEARKEAEESREMSLAAVADLRAVQERAKTAEAKVAQLATALERTMSGVSQSATGGSAAGPSPGELRELTKRIDSVKRDIAGTRAAAQVAQVRTRQAVIAQTKALKSAGGAVDAEGWVWAGQIDSRSGKLRDVGEPETVVAPATYDMTQLKGARITFRASTDIYQEPFDGASQRSALIGVIPAGSTATVIDARKLRFARQGLSGRDPDDQILWLRINPK